MEELTCKECGKKIEGYSHKHVEFLMEQHMWTHKRPKEESQQVPQQRASHLPAGALHSKEKEK